MLGHKRYSLLFLIAVILVIVGCGDALPSPGGDEGEPDVMVVTATPDPNAEATEVLGDTAEPEVIVVTATPGEDEAMTEEPADTGGDDGAEPETTEEPEATEDPPATTGDIPTVTANADWTPQTQSLYGVDWVLVPPGCFEMGAQDSFATNIERPAHGQCFDTPFWIMQTEATNTMFEASGITLEAPADSFWAGDNHPRVNITWTEARDFCRSVGGDIPTERQWEYAARGPSNYRWPQRR